MFNNLENDNENVVQDQLNLLERNISDQGMKETSSFQKKSIFNKNKQSLQNAQNLLAQRKRQAAKKKFIKEFTNIVNSVDNIQNGDGLENIKRSRNGEQSESKTEIQLDIFSHEEDLSLKSHQSSAVSQRKSQSRSKIVRPHFKTFEL